MQLEAAADEVVEPEPEAEPEAEEAPEADEEAHGAELEQAMALTPMTTALTAAPLLSSGATEGLTRPQRQWAPLVVSSQRTGLGG